MLHNSSLECMSELKRACMIVDYVLSIMRNHKRRDIFKRIGLKSYEYALELNRTLTEYEKENVRGQLEFFNWEVEFEHDRKKHVTIVIEVK